MVFLLLVSVLFSRTPYLGWQYQWEGIIKMAAANTPSPNELVKYLVLVHTVHLKLTIKAQISGIMESICISTVMTSVHYTQRKQV